MQRSRVDEYEVRMTRAGALVGLLLLGLAGRADKAGALTAYPSFFITEVTLGHADVSDFRGRTFRMQADFVVQNGSLSRHAQLDGIERIPRLTPTKISQNAGSEDQSYSRREQREGPSYKPPIGGLFFLTILSLLCTFLCGLKGGHHLYEKRRLRAALWLALGGLCGGMGGFAIFYPF